jgi:hypothetical protein
MSTIMFQSFKRQLHFYYKLIDSIYVTAIYIHFAYTFVKEKAIYVVDESIRLETLLNFYRMSQNFLAPCDLCDVFQKFRFFSAEVFT